jgi:hypothetical protein
MSLPVLNVLRAGWALLQASAQAGLVPGGSVFVNCALPHGFVNHRNSFRKRSFGLVAVAGLNGCSEFAQSSAEAGCIGAILPGAFLGLSGALQRRKMVCHFACLCPSVGFLSEGEYQPKLLFYGHLAGPSMCFFCL